MIKTLLAVVALSFALLVAIGCDSGGGGKIEPLSGNGPPSNAAKTGPHPMPPAK